MGDLIRIPNCEVGPTLAVLDELGVTREDFSDLRRHPHFAKAVAGLITERRNLICEAMRRSGEQGLQAAAKLDHRDVALLVDVINKAKYNEVAEFLVPKLPPKKLSEVALGHDVASVAMLAASLLPLANLLALLNELGDCARGMLLAGVYQKRMRD